MFRAAGRQTRTLIAAVMTSAAVTAMADAPASGSAMAGPPAAQDAPDEYTRRNAAPAAQRCTDAAAVTFVVAPEPGHAGVEPTWNAGTGRLNLLYRMAFNQLTEGWNWHPEAALAGDDYYTFKYLPLGSTREERGRYRGEDRIGTSQEFRVEWRTDHFFAFANPYDFYSREAGDDQGFTAEVAVSEEAAARLAADGIRLVLRARLASECLAASTTFWKATSAQPVDLTLIKRYLIGRITDIWFVDAASGQPLAHRGARPSGQAASPPLQPASLYITR